MASALIFAPPRAMFPFRSGGARQEEDSLPLANNFKSLTAGELQPANAQRRRHHLLLYDGEDAVEVAEDRRQHVLELADPAAGGGGQALRR